MDVGKSIIYYEDTGGFPGCFLTWNELQEEPKLSPDIFTHGLHYGRGAFEGIRAVWGRNPEGLQIINLREHTSRLAQSARYLRLMNINPAEVEDSIIGLIMQNAKNDYFDPREGCYVRPLVYSDKVITAKGERRPGLGVYSQEHRKVLAIGLFPWGAYLERNPRVRVYEDGIASPLRKVKATANYGFGGLAKDTAKMEGYDEALITDVSPERKVLEGGGENVFEFSKVRNGVRIRTPSTEQDILPGTKRAVFIEMLRNHGLTIDECAFPLAEFLEAEAAIFTGTATGVVAIGEVYDPVTGTRRFFDSDLKLKPGLRLDEVVAEYDRLIHGEEVHPGNRDLQARIRRLVQL
ncbi:MAG TPA: aminotransferase class IV [Candidatus Nanoarchaeia archaeon]|nr:aminotransferase class IV [Candidatus Nanoarchaeia archaeon]